MKSDFQIEDLVAIAVKEGGGDPLEIFNTALRNAGPSMEVRSRRVGGANYQVPREVRPERRLALALRWIIAWPALHDLQLHREHRTPGQ